MSEIKEITKGEMQGIIATRRPLGNFIYLDNETWVACDNTNGEAFVETFTTKEKALKWINSSIASPNLEQFCRVCGCTWEKACIGGCWWVEEDLCSECVGIENRRTPPFRIVPKEIITDKSLSQKRMTAEEYRNLIVSNKAKSKYKNIRTTVDGIAFDSAREAHRYSELLILQKANQIKN